MQRRTTAIWLVSGIALTASLLVAQQKQTTVKRAKPPKFDPAKVSEYFFEDAFAKVIGERPAANATAVAPTNGSVAASPTVTSGTTSPAASSGGWSQLISSTTIEDEIKAIKREVDKNITTPSDFAGRGHKTIRREFSILAMLFAIIAEYEGDVRFKKDAPAARNLFARAANNTKAGGNTTVFSEAKTRKTDLDELLGGSSLTTEGASEAPDWPTIIDRSPLMQRLETAFQGKVTPALSNKDEFAKNTDAVLHESELIGAMATVLTKEGMSDADDETYAGFAKTMKEAAHEVASAVKSNNYDQARAASGKIDKACSQCHESYR
jgi:hypothetical protein